MLGPTPSADEELICIAPPRRGAGEAYTRESSRSRVAAGGRRTVGSAAIGAISFGAPPGAERGKLDG